MMTFKCKMCGGELEFATGASIAECPYCGTAQTLPKLADDRRANLYDRANHFRRQNEYDKAMAIYEQILSEDRTDAEAYWSLVLCRYGIEYVEDPVTHKRVPTVNRAQFMSILADEDYKSALEYADAAQKGLYEAEAAAIAEIQRGILDISKKEQPFDVFICYKETDANGRRTPDSVLATDLYHQLTKEGFKVFFSRITLEDKIGSAYEPYIFAALNSAKVMVVLGTKPEYFNAVWVKNEWSRYLALIRAGADKTLVPAYRDMDPYDLPEEFAHLQAQDMGKLGFMQDLIRGIQKLTAKREAAPAAQPAAAPQLSAAEPLLRRAFMFLEDGDFAKADDFCEQVLNLDPENARAYLGKLMAELKVRREVDLKDQPKPFDGLNNYQKVMRFGDEGMQTRVKGYIDFINERNELARLKAIYARGLLAYRKAQTVDEFEGAKQIFAQLSEYDAVKARIQDCDDCIQRIHSNAYREAEAKLEQGDYDLARQRFQALGSYRDSAARAEECLQRRMEADYNQAERLMREEKFAEAETAFQKLGNYLDSARQAVKARAALNERHERERRALEAQRQREAAKRRRRNAILLTLVALAVAGYFAATKYFIPKQSYDKAVALRDTGKYEEAIAAFEALEGFGDSEEQIKACENGILEREYQAAVALRDVGKYEEAIAAFEALAGFGDSSDQITETRYQRAKAVYNSGKYEEAYLAFGAIQGYKDVDTLLKTDDNLLAAAAAAAAAALDAQFAVGNIVTFGSYPQTASGTDSTPIEWQVLARDGDKALLLSRYGLDAQPYNTKYTSITWEKCTLRTWLNGTFLNRAFSAKEQGAIALTNVDNGSSQGYSKWSTSGGNNTQDKIFLLSYAEANRYLGVTYDDSNNMQSRVSPTAYAENNGAWTSSSNKMSEGSASGLWWLRSPGSYQFSAAYVDDDGSLNRSRVDDDDGCVRPAFWVNLKSGIF